MDGKGVSLYTLLFWLAQPHAHFEFETTFFCRTIGPTRLMSISDHSSTRFVKTHFIYYSLIQRVTTPFSAALEMNVSCA